MINLDTFRQTALSFPETTEHSNAETTAFLVRGKVFATFDGQTNRACLKFSDIAQDVFSSFDQQAIYPVPETGGFQGWTFIDLSTVSFHVIADALTTAYCEMAPEELANQVRQTWED